MLLLDEKKSDTFRLLVNLRSAIQHAIPQKYVQDFLKHLNIAINT